MKTSLAALLLTALFAGCTPATVPVVDRAPLEAAYDFAATQEQTSQLRAFTLTARPVETMLGDQSTTLWSYGETAEPTVLRVKQGDRVQITIDNALPTATTIHWHGLRVPHAEDGIPHLTQPAIASGASYTYDFVTPDVGTFWFHPHESSAEQIGRGLYAILIVEEATPPAFDRELVWALKDYRLTADGTLAEDWANPHDLTHAGRLGNLATINNQPAPHADTIAPGSHVRLRLVNTSNARYYDLDLTDWQAEIIATDGGYTTEPVPTTTLRLTPGERYDLAVTAPTAGTLTLTDTWSSQPLTLATLAVVGEPTKERIFATPTATIPDWSTIKDETPDHTLTLDGVGVMGSPMGHGRMGSSAWRIGGAAWPDTEPLTLVRGQLTTIRFTNDSIFDHPMHLHGDFFQVLGVNGVTPLVHGWKDTVNVPARGTVDIALIPTNPGEWMLHCHILEHAEIGMMTTVRVE